MKHLVYSLYQRLVLNHPRLCLLVLLAITALAGWQARHFQLDASADALSLENDEALAFYREVSKRYGGSEFLVITYTPSDGELFSRDALARIERLQNEIEAMQRVSSVYTILDVPLLFSPRVEFSELASGYRTLKDEDVDLALAKLEFTEVSPIYPELLVNRRGDTTALLVNFDRDEKYFELLHRRNDLRELRRAGELDREGREEYRRAQQAMSEYNNFRQAQAAAEIARVREIIDGYREHANLFLGGAPMITTDIVSFIRNDLRIFGTGVAMFLIITLFVIFRRPRWIIVPMLCCAMTTVWMIGWLGAMDWKVTVISSNFVSLLLIITMSMTIHLIVRYRELHAANPDADQAWLVSRATALMSRPIIFTALTTMVAFSSLVVSDIRPVIDFGWMMTVGIGVALVICFTLFPALLLPLKPLEPQQLRDFTRRGTLRLARLTAGYTRTLLVIAAGIAVVALIGTSRLTVENRFIDYFQEHTEIYQGMLEIDRELGGTTPLDIILNAPAGRTSGGAPVIEDDPFNDPFNDELGAADIDDDPFADPFDDPFAEADGIAGSSLMDSYWYTPAQLDRLIEIQRYLESLPETGKVLSIATTYEAARKVNEGPLSYVDLMLLSSFIPSELRDQLVRPFLSDDGNQARIMIRMIDSDPNLNRNELLAQIERDLKRKFDLDDDQVQLTGAMVLYNNMLQSLFDSQIRTLGFVFLAILTMFLILFRAFFISLLAMLPNLFSAACILGLMGWIGLPLDLMTITIAAITIGIAVDDTIHYIHRFREEFPKDQDYLATMHRCHGSIGTAMYYTSLTIIAGFSILALSNFNPTIYFGLLTGLAMLVALLSNLTILPALLAVFKPRIPELKE